MPNYESWKVSDVETGVVIAEAWRVGDDYTVENIFEGITQYLHGAGEFASYKMSHFPSEFCDVKASM